jgi:hypothetical protein
VTRHPEAISSTVNSTGTALPDVTGNTLWRASVADNGCAVRKRFFSLAVIVSSLLIPTARGL